MIKNIFLVIIAIIFVACSNNSTDPGTPSLNPKVYLPGTWHISSDRELNNLSVIITNPTDTSLTFYEHKFIGSYSGNSFSGTETEDLSIYVAVYNLNITLKDSNKISGTYKTTTTIPGYTAQSVTETFTGIRTAK